MGSMTPYLCVDGARTALDWYVAHLGATVTYEPIVMPDGGVGHCELDVLGGHVAMSDEYASAGVAAPMKGRGAAVTLMVEHEDVDDLAARVASAGATITRGPEDDENVGRLVVFVDPFGHRWFVHAPTAPAR